MNKRLTKVASFALLVLLTLGEGSQFVYAVTEESTSSTVANEKVLPAKDTVDSAEKTVDSSSEVIKEETSSSSEEKTTESSTEQSEEKKKEKSKATRAADTPVNIPDNNLYQMLREVLNRSPGYDQNISDGTPITEAQMEMLTQFNRTALYSSLDSAVISNLEGLQYATNLESFVLDGKYVQDTFTSLPAGFSNLKKLKILRFSKGVLKNIDELKDHPTLSTFSAEQNDLDSLKGLSGCTELEYLNVNGSDNHTYRQNANIQSFEGLEQSTKLKEIHFSKYDESQGNSLAKVSQPEASYVGFGLQTLNGLNCKDTLEILDLKGHPGLHSLSGLENYNKLTQLSVIGAPNYNGRDSYYSNPGGIDAISFDPAIHTPTYHKRGLRGPNAIDALSSCDSLETVNLSRHAIEDISPLAGKPTISNLNISVNLIETLQPLATTNNLVKLYTEHNLLQNLKGLDGMSVLEHLNASSQNAGAYNMILASGQQNIYYTLKGLLDDVTALNSTSLKVLDVSDNRLEDLSSLKNANNLTTLSASNNSFSDIKGDLAGCSSLSVVNFNNNRFVNFEDTGLEDAKDSLKELYMRAQGLRSNSAGNTTSEGALLENLEGLKNFTIIETIEMVSNQIKDSEMKHIPDCIISLNVSHNELQDEAFSSFSPTTHTRLKEIYGGYNAISDIRPLEAFTTLSRVYIPSQRIDVPEDGGVLTKKTSPIGFEVDVLKSEEGVGFSYNPRSGWNGTTPTIQAGSYIIDVEDPDYKLDGRNPTMEFSFTGNNKINGLTYDGRIVFGVDYGIKTSAKLNFVPTDIEGNPIDEIEPGGIVYWRAVFEGAEDQVLIKPEFKHDLQNTSHGIMSSYTLAEDTQASEYTNGVRVDVNGSLVSTPSGFWQQADVLNNRVNNVNKANITIVTKVDDDAEIGKTANFRIQVDGVNFSRLILTKFVWIKSGAPQELKLSVPDRFDFGKANEATKKDKTYTPAAKSYTSQEQTDGFNVRVTDSRKTTNRTDWEVVAQLSDLTNSKSTALKAGSVAPKLALRDIDLYKIDPGTGAGIQIAHGSTGNPTWDRDVLLTAGGPSVKVTGADSANGEGVWDYRIPFNKVELNIPSNVNDQAGYTFKGKLTWTLDNTL
ncbi:WxL domain-containing protein [Enterococcus sp. DIV0756]|uniref:WxL domain-containing protein n=1 Tax=Enterococcus sp. DIV0756 TaxID=2774636 RepID=UPI003F269072